MAFPKTRIEIGQELVAVIGLSVVLIIVIYGIQAPVVRLGLGLAYVLYLPGHVALAALFPGKGDLSVLDRVTLGFVLSLAVVSLAALGLNLTPWGVVPELVLPVVTSMIILGSGLGYYRRARLETEERFVICLHWDLSRWRAAARVDRALSLVGVLAALFAGVTVLFFIVNPKENERSSAFYMLGPGGSFEGYPTEVVVGEPITVTLGVVSHEHDDTRYRIELETNAGRTEIGALDLVHEEAWEQPFTFSLSQAGEEERIGFLLYKGEGDEPYRSVYLKVRARGKEP